MMQSPRRQGKGATEFQFFHPQKKTVLSKHCSISVTLSSNWSQAQYILHWSSGLKRRWEFLKDCLWATNNTGFSQFFTEWTVFRISQALSETHMEEKYPPD